jgi:Protein phosphatase 2C
MAWSVLGESVLGTSHRAGDTPCQDAFRSSTFGAESDWLVVVVADGAGSASHSDIGANAACEEFIQQCQSLEPSTLKTLEAMIDLFSIVRNKLIAQAERLQVKPRELACTALVAIIGPTLAVFAQIGDGGIVVGDGQLTRVVFWPETTGYANETDFLTDERFATALRFETSAAPVSELALFSDGLQRLALDYASKVPHPPFFRPLFDGLRNATDATLLLEPFRAFLDSDRVNERTDDDKTLALAVCHP